MGELDLEVGGRQKNTTNSSIKQGKNHNFLTTMKAKKNEEHSSSVQIGLFVFSGPLSAILLKEVFSLNCKFI